MDVTAQELRSLELREAWRGYRSADVDELLDRVAGTIERLQAQVQRLSERLTEAESEAGLGREADEMLRRTLLLAQRTADAAVAEAQERARRVLSESEAHAHSIVSGAEEEARRIAIAERQRIENEIRDLSARRDMLLTDVEALEQAARDHRRRLREFLEVELARVDARPLPEAPPLANAAEPIEAEVDLSRMEADPPAGEPVADTPAELDHEEGLAEGVEGLEEFEEPDGTDLLPSKRRRWRLREPEPEPEPADDRFFDELRQAVHDETPLGPRDEEVLDEDGEYASQGSAFFDQDDGRGRG